MQWTSSLKRLIVKPISRPVYNGVADRHSLTHKQIRNASQIEAGHPIFGRSNSFRGVAVRSARPAQILARVGCLVRLA